MRDGWTDAKSLSCVIEGKKEELKEEDKQSLLKALCWETSVVSSDLVCVSGRMSAVVLQNRWPVFVQLFAVILPLYFLLDLTPRTDVGIIRTRAGVIAFVTC